MAPHLFPILVNFGIMGWLGIELSMATSLIATVAIGLAVDDTIHYLVRFNREFKRDLDPKSADDSVQPGGNLSHCLANESRVDDLTHLCNRKGFCGILEQEIVSSMR